VTPWGENALLEKTWRQKHLFVDALPDFIDFQSLVSKHTNAKVD